MKIKMNMFFILVILIQSQIALSLLRISSDMTCAGARAAGMGGAFIGVADDATAIIWNPAGLINITQPENSIISTYNSSKSEFVGWENQESHFNLDFVSAAYPLKNNNLVVSVAYQKPMDFYIDFLTDEENMKSKGGGYTFTAGFAYRILPYFFSGLSMNSWFGNIDFEYHYYEHEYSVSNSDWYDYESIYNCEQTLTGFNVILGGFIDFDYLDDPIPLTFGITYRSAFDLKAKENGLFSEYVEWESGEDYYYEQSTDGSIKNEIPTMVGFGASYCFIDNFKMAADYEIRAYKDSKINQHNENLKYYRIGAEYILETDFVTVPLRIGYYNEPTILADANMQQVIGSGYSLGIGLTFDRFVFDIAYTRSAHENYRGYYGNQDTSYSKLVFSGILYY